MTVACSARPPRVDTGSRTSKASGIATESFQVPGHSNQRVQHPTRAPISMVHIKGGQVVQQNSGVGGVLEWFWATANALVFFVQASCV